ncbi:MAG: magnesium transporter [Pseudomonadota bacterium]
MADVEISNSERSGSADAEIIDVSVKRIDEAVAESDASGVTNTLDELHPADQADVIQLLPNEARVRVVQMIGSTLRPETFSYLEGEIQADLFRLVGPHEAAEVLEKLDTDDAVEILGKLDIQEQASILSALPRAERAAIEQGLNYPEDSAGRLMARAFVAVPDYWVVGQTIDFSREGEDLPEEFFEIYIVDARYRPVGTVPVGKILRSRRSVAMRDLALNQVPVIQAEMDQEEVAFLFRQYDLVAAPVVGANGRLLGVITVDDVVDVIQEEAEEDILRLGGVNEADTFARPIRTALRRLPWLAVNLVTAVLASLVIANFEDDIARFAALAVLMPIVASMGGNAGTQTLTVAVRALATREITTSNTGRVFLKELGVALINASLFLFVGIALAIIWFGDYSLAIVFGIAIGLTLISAGLAGLAIPLAINRFKMDPAVSSGVFLTTVTDVVGFLAFLGLASLILL